MITKITETFRIDVTNIVAIRKMQNGWFYKLKDCNDKFICSDEEAQIILKKLDELENDFNTYKENVIRHNKQQAAMFESIVAQATETPEVVH